MSSTANNNSLDSPILETSITLSYVQKRLQEFFNTASKFGNNRKFFRIGVGEGFASVIIRLYPEWVPPSPELPKTVVVKIPHLSTAKAIFTNDSRFEEMFTGYDSNRNDMMDSMVPMLKPGHNAEVLFYEMVRRNNIDMRVPKLYFGEQFSDTCEQGLLLLEDVGSDCVSSKPYQNLSVSEVKQVLKTLAAVGAFSLAHPESVKVGQITMASVVKNFAKANVLFPLIQSAAMNDETLSKLYEEIMEYKTVLEDLSVLDTAAYECGLPDMLVHGDLWSTNVMWRVKADGSHELAGIVDWQLNHTGTPAEDIVRFISCTMSAEDRRKYTDELLLYYYNEVEHAYNKQLPFTFQQFKDSFLKICAQAMTQILPILGPISQADLESRFPDQKEKLSLLMRTKCKGLFEDIVAILKQNY